MSQTIIKKLSVKTVVGSIAKPAQGETVKICRFVGIARALKSVPTTFGDSTGLIGDFAGINLESGETMRAGVLYAPAVLLDMIAPRVEQGEVVEFAFDVSITGDKSVAVGYRYGLETIIEPAENDPMQKLLAGLPAVSGAPALTSRGEAEKPKVKGK